MEKISTMLKTGFFITILLFASIILCSGLTCNDPDGPCKCATDEGQIDLSALSNSDGNSAQLRDTTTIG